MRTIADKMAKRMSQEEREAHLALCGLLEEEETKRWKDLQAAVQRAHSVRDKQNADVVSAARYDRAVAFEAYEDIARIRAAMEPSTWKLGE